MKIGLIRYKFDGTGGAERTLGLLARGLLKRGHEVHALVTAWEGVPPEGLVVHHPSKSAAKSPGAFYLGAASEMKRLGLDTFISLERSPGSPIFRAGDGCHAAWLKRRSRYENRLKRWSFKVNPKHRRILELERRTLADDDLYCVIANSKMVAGELIRYYNLSPAKLEIIHNGVDLEPPEEAEKLRARKDIRGELGLAMGDRVALFLGAGFERKGLLFAIDALSLLRDAVLLVAGKDKGEAFRRRAGRLGLSDRVLFLGHRPDAQALVMASDAMVLPTIYDPCSNSCLEALVAGVPVVTTQANGAAELIDPGVSGVVVQDPKDSRKLAGAISQAFEMKGPFAHDVPDMDDWLDRMIRVIEKAASEKKNR